MAIDDFNLRIVDLLSLFVFGFAFLIMSIDLEIGMKYFLFIAFGSLCLMVINALNKFKHRRK